MYILYKNEDGKARIMTPSLEFMNSSEGNDTTKLDMLASKTLQEGTEYYVMDSPLKHYGFYDIWTFTGNRNDPVAIDLDVAKEIKIKEVKAYVISAYKNNLDRLLDVLDNPSLLKDFLDNRKILKELHKELRKITTIEDLESFDYISEIQEYV